VPTNHIRGLGDLMIATVDRIAAPTEGVHRAVARRTFGAVGPAGRPVRTVHDAVATGVYSSLRLASSVVRAGARAGVGAVLGDREVRVLEANDRGLKVLASLNAAFGDRFEAEGNDLCIEMQLRHGGRRLRPEPGLVAAGVADPTARIAVFVHGLAGTERDWHRGRGDEIVPSYEPPRTGKAAVRLADVRLRRNKHRAHGSLAYRLGSYGEQLHSALGYTPVEVRYNTGRHISDNGRDLAESLEQLVAAWPVTVEELVVVGHSMGGLVLRSACHQAPGSGHRWVDLVRHAAYLGTPHRGAPLEQLANLAVSALGVAGESRPFAELANVRSAGIKDLRFGYLLEEDWQGHDPDLVWDDNRTTVPLLATATHGFVAATLHSRSDGLAGRTVGDLLVPFASAAPPGWVILRSPILRCGPPSATSVASATSACSTTPTSAPS